MAVRFKKGINWDYYGVDILKYDYLSAKGGAKANRDNFINTEEMQKELQREGVDKDAARKRFMGTE